MLRGRETNLSKVGRWSRAECCHMGARYLPVDYPKVIDRMSYRVYVGNFSSDGSLFVGGFQVGYDHFEFIMSKKKPIHFLLFIL
jgi:WD repeat-containing protein 23